MQVMVILMVFVDLVGKMTVRFPAMIASINNAIKTHKTSINVPINKFCYKTLNKLRDYGILTGFHFFNNNAMVEKSTGVLAYTKKRFKWMRGQPKVTVFLNIGMPRYINLKGYPLTPTNFKSVRWHELQKNVKISINKHTRHRHILITASQGLFWDYEIRLYKKHKIGGKFLFSVIRRV
jgi:ribosomal protein S8